MSCAAGAAPSVSTSSGLERQKGLSAQPALSEKWRAACPVLDDDLGSVEFLRGGTEAVAHREVLSAIGVLIEEVERRAPI